MLFGNERNKSCCCRLVMILFLVVVVFTLSFNALKTSREIKNSHIGTSTASLSAPASLSVRKFFLHYPHKTSCLVIMRTNQMIKHGNFSQLVYKETLETDSSTSYDVRGAERVNTNSILHLVQHFNMIFISF